MLFQENMNLCKGNNFPSLATGGKGHADGKESNGKNIKYTPKIMQEKHAFFSYLRTDIPFFLGFPTKFQLSTETPNSLFLNKLKSRLWR